MVQRERIPVIRSFVDAGLVIGAVVTEESMKAGWKLTSGVARFAGRQSLQTARRALNAADLRLDTTSFSEEPIMSREEAVENFVVALATWPDDAVHVESTFTVLADKIQNVHKVTDGIRLRADTERLVSTQEIARGYVGQVAERADYYGIPPETSDLWIRNLCQRVGIELELPEHADPNSGS